MNRRMLAIVVLVPFSILSLYALYQVGYIGLWDYQLRNPSGWQVTADLVVACVLILTWLVPEAQRNGRNPCRT